VGFHQTLRDRQTETRATRFGGEQGCEDLLANLQRDTGSAVAERDLAARVANLYDDPNLPLPCIAWTPLIRRFWKTI
jgi:hypothetical protein